MFKRTLKEPDTRLRHERWADTMSSNFDVFQYLLFFILIGIPIYYTIGYTMPIFLAPILLMFHGANAIPRWIKRAVHPVLVTALVMVLVSWVISLTQGHSLQWGLQRFKTGNSYLQYFIGVKSLPPPSAGDILTSMLDATIVAWAMPMLRLPFRPFATVLIEILVPNLFLAIPSLFIYPALCFAIGTSPTNSLAFAPCSITLALAQTSPNNLGGNFNVITPVVVVSGICGLIIGPTILKLIRIPGDDYVTKGVVLAANSSAIATAILLEAYIRAAALSSLSMSVFGILFVVLTAIPPGGSAPMHKTVR
ncbi:hypothetical protein LTS18_008343 [Coniosporium uncinatum]|uniref:Uncharacterized protein n=1 Tax=Coniosporium uncinatum TaxID=93489 RepID=A0ACC3DA97_9PEZI|nr:hypothetical protein LTS18_008343 [Coniosporium uncinatum]